MGVISINATRILRAMGGTAWRREELTRATGLSRVQVLTALLALHRGGHIAVAGDARVDGGCGRYWARSERAAQEAYALAHGPKGETSRIIPGPGPNGEERRPDCTGYVDCLDSFVRCYPTSEGGYCPASCDAYAAPPHHVLIALGLGQCRSSLAECVGNGEDEPQEAQG